MNRQYFCQTVIGLDTKDRVHFRNVEETQVIVGFESENVPCEVYLNVEQVTDLVALLTKWLEGDGETKETGPKLWEDA